MEKELPCSSSPFRSRPVSRPRLVTLIILGVCAAVALSTALQLLLVDYFAVRYARQEAQLRLQQLSWQMRDALNHVMEEAAGNVALVAGLAPVREARAPADARSVLDNLQKAVPDYAWIGIADISGKVFAAAGGLLEGEDVSKRPWFSQGGQSLSAVDYHPALLLGKLLPASQDPWRFIDMAVPVRRADGSSWGVLGVHLSWNWARRLARNLLTPALREYGAEILVVRNDAVILLGPPGMEEHTLNTASLRLAQAGGTGSVRETWPDGKVYLTGYSQTGQAGDGASLQWSVLVRQPETVALAASRNLEQLILWLSMALAAALALATALLARRLTRPLDSLSSVVEQRARASGVDGPLPPIPVIGTFHEAQVLSQAMREMVLGEERHVHLHETMNEQLETTVAARTAELQKLVMRDALTGLLNRRALMQALPEAMRRSVRLQKPCAVMFLDLDGFKKINDTHGHEEGDELLRQFGQRIVHAVRGTDTVARLAGDEFVVILENLAAPNDAEAMGRKIMPRLREPFYLKAATVHLSASIGVAVHVAELGEDLDALLARADRAMYQAKRQGKNNVVMAPALN